MSIPEEAYIELFSEKPEHEISIKYSGKFRGYNANIKMNSREITINASRNWKGVSPEITKGLIQELLVRIFKAKKNTINMDLYNNFIKSLPKVIPQTKTNPVLEESFNRVNETFFNGTMNAPNFKVGKGINRLGTYEYGTDTIMISEILLNNEKLMDYVMYHEALHKKHQYTSRNGRTKHHSTFFRNEEKKFPNSNILDKELEKLVKTKKTRSFFEWF